MTRIGRSSDWLGDAGEASFLTHAALPRKTRDVKFAAIKTADDARQYARRFFHGAVDSAAKLPKSAGDVRARWALAAKQYVLAHDLAGQGGSLRDVVAGLAAADLNSASAILARKVGDDGQRPPLGPATNWSPPVVQDAPPAAPGSPVATSPASPAPRPAPPSSGPPATIPAAPPAAPSPIALPGGSAASELAPATVEGEWLVESLLPPASRKVKLDAVKSLADAKQYARRFFHGAVTHGTKGASSPVTQRWAEAARIYVYAHRLADDPFIAGALAAVLNDLRAADILSAQALAAEKGGALAPVTIRWFTSPELAKRGLATFELIGSLEAPSSSSAPAPSSPGTVPATLETPAGLPRRFDVLIDRFRGPIPTAFVRALIMAESGFNPSSQHPTSDARGLLQVTRIVLEDWNKTHPADQVTADQLFDPVTNLKLGIGTLRHIVESYDRAHPSMRMNFRSARYVEVLAEAWNVGYSERAGVGLILSAFESSGVTPTVDNIVERAPQVAGLPEKVAQRIVDRGVAFPRRVRQLYFGELERGDVGGRPQLLTAGLGDDAALVVFSGLMLFGDDLFARRRS